MRLPVGILGCVSFKATRNAFISGLILLAPVSVTVYVVNLLISFLGGPSSRLFFFFVDEELVQQYTGLRILLTVISAFFVIVLITIFGWLSKRVFGRMILLWFERLMTGMPLVRSLYNSVKQIVDTLARNQKSAFSTTVLIEYPRKGVYVIGFLTGDAKGEIQDKTQSYLLCVFVPTTPNPTSGFMLMVPKEEITELDMPVSDGMKAIISGGAVMPPSTPAADVLPEGPAA